MPGPRGLLILLAIAVVTFVLLPVHWLALRADNPLHKRTARLWHKIACRLLGFRITVAGTAPAAGKAGVLLVANHASWLDILVLGSVAEVSFIAKDDVKTWPVFGQLARLQDCLFVSREKRTEVATQTESLAARLERGDTMVLFPEGTTSCGNFVRPFKSALFGALAASGRHKVQPVAIAYVGVDGLPMGRYFRPLATWPGTLELAPHLSRILREGRLDIVVTFGATETVAPGFDRKALAGRMEEQVRAMMSDALLGRPASSQDGRLSL